MLEDKIKEINNQIERLRIALEKTKVYSTASAASAVTIGNQGAGYPELFLFLLGLNTMLLFNSINEVRDSNKEKNKLIKELVK